jgi:uncharacterized zinc-type alcohol dehydrogenase-like protein
LCFFNFPIFFFDLFLKFNGFFFLIFFFFLSNDFFIFFFAFFDFILNTANADLEWNNYIGALKPKGHLHTVGAVPSPMAINAFPLILGQKSLSGSPLGSPATTDTMLQFAARHGIVPTTEHFPMSRANEALEHLRSGKARYRVVLTNDLA